MIVSAHTVVDSFLYNLELGESQLQEAHSIPFRHISHMVVDLLAVQHPLDDVVCIWWVE